MKAIKILLVEISKLTRDIETNYPELYKYLDENPVTIPNMDSPKVDAKELENYLKTLQDLLEKHKSNLKKR
ncbi:MAG TPA: hypothetical protein VJ945_01760 [Flavobacteriaceae bacterium]|jgi:hypothetical protein|nr:hypothetical protein [Flavobacteriaceae bacterium]